MRNALRAPGLHAVLESARFELLDDVLEDLKKEEGDGNGN